MGQMPGALADPAVVALNKGNFVEFFRILNGRSMPDILATLDGLKSFDPDGQLWLPSMRNAGIGVARMSFALLAVYCRRRVLSLDYFRSMVNGPDWNTLPADQQRNLEAYVPARKTISGMSTGEKLGEAMRRSLPRMPAESRRVVEGLLTPASLAIMGAVTAAWVAAQFFGVGEIADILILLVGGAFLGKSMIDVAQDIEQFLTLSINATSDADLDRAGEYFARAVAVVGINVIVAVIMHKTSTSLRTRMSKTVEPQTRARLFNKPKMTGDPTLPAGTGGTDKFGNMEYSTQGTPQQQNLVKFHESVHSALSPKFRILQNFRADLAMTAYQRSQFLRYLEEALSETYAQLKVNGVKGVPDGIKFPLNGGYALTIKGIATEAAIGTVVAGGVAYAVYVYASE